MKERAIMSRSEAASKSALALLDLLDHAEGIQCWVKDKDGVIQWANRLLILQYSDSGRPEDVIGKTDYELSPKAIADKFRDDDDRVLKGNPVVNREELVTGVDHLAAWYITTKIPMYDSEGVIIGTVGMTHPKNHTSSDQLDPGLPKVLSYIREHYMESPDNSLLALLLGQSEEELLRLFEAQLQMTPAEYLRRARVRLACHDLVDAQLSFDEIARKHGFADQEQFVSDFREETGETPRVYRLKLFQRGAVRL